MLLSLLLIPIIGASIIFVNKDRGLSLKNIKLIALTASILNFLLSLVIFILFDFSTNQFQFVQECHEMSYFDFYLGVDGLSIYFVLLTTIIIPISLLSNWTSISKHVKSYVIMILLLETLLLAVFLVLDILLFYIFFESILPPLFILIGIFGSDNRVTASFYLFLYTLLGSLFLLLSIIAMSSILSTTDFETLFKGNFMYLTQLFLFYGIFIAFAVKTPTIFLNTWLLKAHVESPLGGSILLAAIVLKLSLYGIFRLILPLLPKSYMEYTYIIFLIGVITIVYASLSTLRTIDVKELIAYSSVSHAAVYLIGVFSNSIQGIGGGINLGLAHGLVSPGLFICAGGILYDRSHTRLISFYKGMAQILPLFAILFFILCLGNCGSPLTLNFVGEFMSLYGVFERSSLFGALASSSIVFSAAYTIYMYQRISFGGSYSRMFTVNITDLNKREFTILLTLVIPTVFFGIYTAPIMDGINYSVSTLIYCFDISILDNTHNILHFASFVPLPPSEKITKLSLKKGIAKYDIVTFESKSAALQFFNIELGIFNDKLARISLLRKNFVKWIDKENKEFKEFLDLLAELKNPLYIELPFIDFLNNEYIPFSDKMKRIDAVIKVYYDYLVDSIIFIKCNLDSIEQNKDTVSIEHELYEHILIGKFICILYILGLDLPVCKHIAPSVISKLKKKLGDVNDSIFTEKALHVISELTVILK